MADKARRQILRLLRAEEIPLEGNDGDQTVLDRDVRLDQTAAIYTAAAIQYSNRKTLKLLWGQSKHS